MDIPRPRAISEALAALPGDGRGPGVLAVSGGADSVAMLRAARQLPQLAGTAVAHFNHQLRGAESDADAAFVKTLAGDWPFYAGTADVRAAAAVNGENIEATARRLRYAFLLESARAAGASWVATAHTADDQAETVLHRMIRGSGLRGLRGIAPVRPLGAGVLLIRPMLDVTRADVLAFLKETNQPWREDATNQDQAYTRNRIRHELLPLLKTFNPQLTDALGRLAAQAQEVYSDVDTRVTELLATVERPRAGAVVILDRAALAGVADHDVRELFRHVWEREGWPTGAMTRDHWQRAAAVTTGMLTATDMPAGLHVRAAGTVVRVGPRG